MCFFLARFLTRITFFSAHCTRFPSFDKVVGNFPEEQRSHPFFSFTLEVFKVAIASKVPIFSDPLLLSLNFLHQSNLLKRVYYPVSYFHSSQDSGSSSPILFPYYLFFQKLATGDLLNRLDFMFSLLQLETMSTFLCGKDKSRQQ